MGKFCTHCGRPLQEGEICTCQTISNQNANAQQPTVNQAPPIQQQIPPIQQQVPPVQQVPPIQQQVPPVQQVPPIQQQVPPVQQQVPPIQQQIPPVQPQVSPNVQATKELANQVKGNFLRLLKNPVTVGKMMIGEADTKMAVIFLILQAVASSLFGIAVGGKINSLIATIGGLTGGFDLGLGSAMAGMLKVSYGKVFAVTFLLSLIFSCVLALLLWLAHMALHCEASFQRMLSVAAIRSAVMVPTILVSLLLFELNVGVGLFLLVVGNVWGFITMTVAMAEFIPEQKKDIFPLVISLAILVFIVVVMLVMGEGWTLYLPDAVRTAVKAIDGYISDPSQLLGDLLEEIL